MTAVVCLSEGYDLKDQFGPAFAQIAPDLTLFRPGEVIDRAAVRYVFAHAPAPDAFRLFPNLAMISSWGAGVDKLLMHPALPEGVIINRMTDQGQAEMMAAFALHYVTGWHRRIFDYPAQQRGRVWREIDWTANADFPIGILGYGNMGAAIGRALKVLGFPVWAWASRARTEDGVQLLSGDVALGSLVSDVRVLVNVLPLTEATYGILDAALLGKMRPDALLVQLARGAHLVEGDLIPALDAGRPAMAALDVFETEPLPDDHPFWRHPGIMLTPHIGSTASEEAVARSVARAIDAHKAGHDPEGLVDPSRGY